MPLSGCQTRLIVIILKGVKIEPESGWSWPLTLYVVTTKRQACNIVPGPPRLTGDEWAARALDPSEWNSIWHSAPYRMKRRRRCQINFTDLKSVKDAQRFKMQFLIIYPIYRPLMGVNSIVQFCRRNEICLQAQWNTALVLGSPYGSQLPRAIF